MKILVVDDNPQIRTTLTGLLQDNAYQTSSCEDGRACLKRLENDDYEIIILDVMMPGPDGLQVLKSIKKRYPEQKVLMMSGRSDLSTAVEATKLGAVDFFEKPLLENKVEGGGQSQEGLAEPGLALDGDHVHVRRLHEFHGQVLVDRARLYAPERK